MTTIQEYLKSEIQVFFSGAFPCNTQKALGEMTEILKQSNTNCVTNVKGELRDIFRAYLWFINSQVFGQLATINNVEEWTYLREKLEETRL